MTETPDLPEFATLQPADLGGQPTHAAEKDVAEKDKVDWLGELRGLVWMLLAVLAFHSFIAKPFYIPSISMMPNQIGRASCRERV